MKKQYTPLHLLALLLFFGSTAHAQDQFTRDFEPIRKELVSWDPVRGEWLSNSMVAMAKNEPVPDRNFPEDYTPAEMLRAVPQGTRDNISAISQNQALSNRTSETARNWNNVNSFVQRPGCNPVTGRSYGDPHLSSFDGGSFSFQTVGEFILARSLTSDFEIQVRQRPQSDNFSLNTAAAMNVGGDRLCVYANEKPDGNASTPLRLEGEALYVEDQTYYLPHGGTVRQVKNDNYEVRWPSGETALFDISRTGGMGFLNISVQVYPCADNYEGILGNANGRSSDDFLTRGYVQPMAGVSSSSMQEIITAERARDFARSWWINPPTSLFDYGFGQSNEGFTDLRFPVVHITLDDMAQNDRDRARRECQRQGFTGPELNACIYDRGFLNIPAKPKPVISDRASNDLKPVTNPTPNVNPGNPRKPVVTSGGTVSKNPAGTPDGNPSPATSATEDADVSKKPAGNGNPPAQTLDKPNETTGHSKEVPAAKGTAGETTKPVYSTPVEEKKPVAKPVYHEESKPVAKPVYTPEVKKPEPKPVYTPPVEKPKPAVTFPKTEAKPVITIPKTEPKVSTPAKTTTTPVKTTSTPIKTVGR